jgi:hypothetical protein
MGVSGIGLFSYLLFHFSLSAKANINPLKSILLLFYQKIRELTMAKLTFISWNVNGIRAVEKKEALKWIDDENVDFLGLQEIKAEAEQIPETIFDRNYKFQSINSSSKKGQSGVALYTDIKEDFISTQ